MQLAKSIGALVVIDKNAYGLEQKRLARKLMDWEIRWMYANPQFYNGIEHQQTVKKNIIRRHCLNLLKRMQAFDEQRKEKP